MDMIKGKLFFFYYLRNKLLDLRSRKNSVIAGAVVSSFPRGGNRALTECETVIRRVRSYLCLGRMV